jgi:sulfate permease, SulP family
LSVILFGWQAAQIRVTAVIERDGHKVYHVTGQLFFGSATPFTETFDWDSDPDQVAIDFHRALVWDHGAAMAIAKVVSQYQRLGKSVLLVGLNPESLTIVRRAGVTVNSILGEKRSEQAA